MAKTRDIFVDGKSGADFTNGERLTSSHMSAVFSALRQMETTLNRAACSNWRQCAGSTADTPDGDEGIVFSTKYGMWYTGRRGTSGHVYLADTSGSSWATKTSATAPATGFQFKTGAADGSGTVVLGGGSPSTNTNEKAVRTTDGTTFDTVTVGSSDMNLILTMFWDPDSSLFIAAVGSDEIYSSADGSTWTARTSSAALTWEDSASNEESGSDAMMIVTADSTDTYYYSSNGTSWSTGTFPASGSYRIAYCKGQSLWFAADDSNAYTSTDGISWSAITVPNNTEVKSVGGIGDLMIAHVKGSDFVTSGESFFFSSDGGTTWTMGGRPGTSVSPHWGYSDRQIIWFDDMQPYVTSPL